MPHLSNECLDELNIKDREKWPAIEEKFLQKKNFDIVIQINGKKRDLMSFDKDIDEKNLLIEVKKNEKLKKFLENREVRKSIYIKNKLINLIV